MQQTAKKLSLTYRSSNPPLNPNPQFQRLLIQKQFNEQRLLKQLSYKQESFHLFQNDHNLKLQQYSQQMNTQILSIKRKYQLEIDGLKGAIIKLEGDLRQSIARQHQRQADISDLSSSLEETRMSLVKAENGLNEKDRNIGQLAAVIQDLQQALNNSQTRNRQMQQQIILLLQVEKNQSNEISILHQNQIQQRQKTEVLANTLTQIESHLQNLTQKLQGKEGECMELKYLVSKMDTDIIGKQEIIQKMTEELEQSVRREKIREEEVKHLIVENQRLYNQLNTTRHRLHDLAISYNIKI